MNERRRLALDREPPYYEDLTLTLAEAWRLLADGVGNAANAFHQPVLASTARDGSADARVAVLRQVNVALRELYFHSDVRSGKVHELAHDPRALVLAYDAASKVQLRLGGTMQVHHGDSLVAAAWAETRQYSRQCYRIAQPPGSVLATPQLANFQPDADSDCGVENFCVLRFTVQRLEWLYLAASGHRRACFDWQAQNCRSQWLAP